MPRPLPRPERSEVARDEVAAYDRVMGRFLPPGADPTQGATPNCYFATLLVSPPFADNRRELSTLIRTAGERDDTYSHTDREFVDQVLSPLMKTNVVMRRHVPDAIAAGVRIEAIEALRSGRDEDLTEDELLLATFTRQTVTGTLSDEIWDRMQQRLGDRGIVEFVVFITALHMTMLQQTAFRCPDPPDEEIDEMLREFKAGTRELPNWRDGIR